MLISQHLDAPKCISYLDFAACVSGERFHFFDRTAKSF